MRALLLVLLPLSSFAASPILFGGRGGIPFSTTDSIAGQFGAASPDHQFEIGPTVGLRLPVGFSVEADALFRRQTYNIGQFGGFTAASTHNDSWQFPVMLKFTAGRSAIAPVLGAGV